MLINSPNPVGKDKRNANFALFPHMGIVQLATRVRKSFEGEVEVKIVDGGIYPLEKILQQITEDKPDLVGISVLTPSYEEGLKIALYAKESGAKVVLGDDHAIFFPELILSKRPYVDYIIINDVGEQPFVELIESLLGRRTFDRVCSLAYRSHGTIKQNPKKAYNLSDLNIVPDLDFIAKDLNIYSDRYYQAFGHLHGGPIKIVTINNARGCENWFKRCSYCSIADLRINCGSPKQFWSTVDSYHENYGINLFFEVYDSFTASPNYIKMLLDAMPLHIASKIENGDIEFMVYARTRGLLRTNTMEYLRRLGVRRVNIGLDSGSSKMLIAQRKNHTTNETNIEALKLIQQNQMTVHGSFMLGALGESEETAQQTLDHIKQSLTEVTFSSLEISMLYPLPNSPIWDILINFDKPQFYRSKAEIDEVLATMGIQVSEAVRQDIALRYKSEDSFNSEQLRNDWYKNYTHITQDYVQERILEVDRLLEPQRVRTGRNAG